MYNEIERVVEARIWSTKKEGDGTAGSSQLGGHIMTKVIIKDELMGTGKSTRMIEEINNSHPDQRYIVVVPFLAEAHRYAGTLSDPDSGDYQTPLRDERGVVYTGTGCNASGRTFNHPQSGHRSKVEHIERLVERGCDIVTTHAALKLFTPFTREAIKDAGFQLVIDEELECLSQVNLKTLRKNILLDSGSVFVDDMGLLRWSESSRYSPSDDEGDNVDTGLSWEMRIKSMCDNGSLVLVEDEMGGRNLFIWEYPLSFIKAFDKVTVLTYMFEGSLFSKYLETYGLDYEVHKGVQIPDNPFDLINVVDNSKMNKAGSSEFALSASSQRKLTKDSAVSKDVSKNLHNFFNNSTYGKSNMGDRLWTCLKGSKKNFTGRGYTNRHIACNTKAVNDFSDTFQLAYVHNTFMQPEQFKFLKSRGEDFAPDLEKYALSEMLQWIYRSRVRDDKEINLYLPSSRMRGFLEDWMDGKVV
jgi:hypothetical protein